MSKKKRDTTPVYATMLNIRPSFSTVYNERLDGSAQRSIRFERNAVNLRNNDTRGRISKKARLNLQSAIDWLIAAAPEKEVHRTSDNSRFKFRVNFVTLTLSASQFYETEGGERRKRNTDQEIKSKILGPFLDAIRHRYGVKNYLWRAEAQVTTGNIHFHLLTDKFIHYEQLRSLWNDAQERLGYVTRFEQKHGHRNPNSTDVHSVRKIRKLAAYLVKYMAKDGKGRAIEGRQWFLSESLQGMKSVRVYLNDVEEDFRETTKRIGDQARKCFNYCEVYLINAWEFLKAKGGKIAREIQQFLEPLRTFEQPQIYTV